MAAEISRRIGDIVLAMPVPRGVSRRGRTRRVAVDNEAGEAGRGALGRVGLSQDEVPIKESGPAGSWSEARAGQNDSEDRARIPWGREG